MREALQRAAAWLAQRGIAAARLDAELLLADVLQLRRLDLYLQLDRPLASAERDAYRQALQRRARGEPVQYIGGRAAFRSLMLAVDRRVLIPRPETEQLVERVLRWARGRPDMTAVDIGTGSGAIALSLACEGPFVRVVGTDVSADALAVAQANAAAVQPLVPLEWRQGDLFAPLAGEVFDVVVSNPPYVDPAAAATLPPEVRDWEPPVALFAPDGGRGVLRALVAQAPAHLRPGGLLALEIGEDQGAEVRAWLEASGAFAWARIEQDWTGRDRYALAERAGP